LSCLAPQRATCLPTLEIRPRSNHIRTACAERTSPGRFYAIAPRCRWWCPGPPGRAKSEVGATRSGLTTTPEFPAVRGELALELGDHLIEGRIHIATGPLRPEDVPLGVARVLDVMAFARHGVAL